MDCGEFKLIPLVERTDLCADVISLLNQEWPRSVAAREHSISKSLNHSPPMSFVLIERNTGILMGHARLCTLPNEEQGCWIESVIVDRSMRNRGLGRHIMRLLETAAKSFSFNKCYLSTEDKQRFYEKCGYECCEPILNVGANTMLLKNHNLTGLLCGSQPQYGGVDRKGVVRSGTVTRQSPDVNDITIIKAGTPPPPPPPPLFNSSARLHSSSADNTKRTQYMCKILH
ncbi:unnamed protein product [Anisakis simplex]|uniref:N-acetyltransferase 6 (inferred by orthology to a human protein) n=1 Tax=Anisakis simplex TaxID=6269 RepID=A0A0M3JTI5_ANISI|nr:unnamed protein product [Anisakis simplex]